METTLLDPKLVAPSRWSNRHESSFGNNAFRKLKDEISHAGGNVQPIKVRRTLEDRYEIVFGHRRHRACLEIGVPVLAVIVDADDRKLWEEMERENRGREDLSPYEQGHQYRSALDAGLYPSMRRLAEAIGVDVSQVSKVIRIAELPPEVVAAFPTPSDIHVNWSSALHAALARDPDGVLSRARALTSEGENRQRPKVVFGALVGIGSVERFHTQEVEITEPKTGARAVITRGRKGRLSVAIEGAHIPLAALEASIRSLLQA